MTALLVVWAGACLYVAVPEMQLNGVHGTACNLFQPKANVDTKYTNNHRSAQNVNKLPLTLITGKVTSVSVFLKGGNFIVLNFPQKNELHLIVD